MNIIITVISILHNDKQNNSTDQWQFMMGREEGGTGRALLYQSSPLLWQYELHISCELVM